MLPNIVLIGSMGCGKSSVGRRLSALTGHRFVDTDDLIVHAKNQAITEIFATLGEEAFRDIEEKTLADLVGVAGVVLATGGGAVLRESNRSSLKKIGTIAWLDADPEVLFERASRSQRRPLLQTENPRQTFHDLLASRRAIYEATADFRLDSTGLAHDDVARKILEQTMRRQAR
ncbi:MAG: shikimate kinase [Chthoniobacterales bacterium]|nr:shikimate kinase [Chthoniobacterales bacterium]